MQNNSRVYNIVNFPEYLDNGNWDVQLHTSNALIDIGFDSHNVSSSNPKTPNISLSTKPTKNNNGAYTPNKTPKVEEDSRKNQWYKANMVQVCSDMVGESLVDASFPGGIYRQSCRMFFEDGRSLIATCRLAPGRALLEERVLKKLYQQGSSVPEVYAFNGLVLLQEDLTGIRLDAAIEASASKELIHLANGALSSLAEIHQNAEKTGLDQAVPMIGYHPDWLISFLDRSAVIGNFVGLPCPNIPADELYDLLVLLKPRFVKWDARPGNAMLADDGKITWFDWEHCAVRNRLDDMAWFLCDEKIPDNAEAEDQIIQENLEYFSDGKSLDLAHDYLRVYGVLHMCVRLGRLLNNKGDMSWEQLDQLSSREQPGRSLMHAQRLCSRASRWSDNMPAIAHLKSWFLQLSDHMKTL